MSQYGVDITQYVKQNLNVHLYKLFCTSTQVRLLAYIPCIDKRLCEILIYERYFPEV